MKTKRWHWVLLLIVFGVSLAFARDYSDYAPDVRKTLASDWLEAGKAYLQVRRTTKARNSFLHAHRLYPMGPAAAEARELLLQRFNVRIVYDPDATFALFVSNAQLTDNLERRINLYLMALDARREARIYEQVALSYLQLGQNDKAKEFAFLAIEAGLPEGDLDSRLRNL